MNPNLTVATLFATAVFVAAASYSNLSFGGFVAPSNAREDNAAMAKAAIELKNTLAGKNRVMLVAVKSAKVTEISGKSFHFCLAVADNSVRFDVKAAVYRDISGRLFLLEWKPNGC
ncbi:MAG: hypothetical protein WCC66_02310 [Rhizobiaceae bacterium]